MNPLTRLLVWLLLKLDRSIKRLIMALLASCLVLSLSHAQTAVLMPMPVIQFSDVNGNPLAGGFVYTYEAGTSINQTTYTDSTGATANTDPIVLNAAGEPSSPLGPGFAGGIYLTNGANYRICVQSYLSVQQWCADNIQLSQGAQLGSSMNGQVLYNCGGNVCGSAGLTYNAGTSTLSVTALNVAAGGSLNGTFTGNPSIANLTVPGQATVGTGVFTVVESNSTINCPTGAPASFGFIRMCNTDFINWRDATNSFDEGLNVATEGSLDVLREDFPGGILLQGAQAYIYINGITSSFPVIANTGSTVDFYQGNGGAVPVAFTNIQAAEATLNGVLFPTGSPSAAGQVLTTTDLTHATWVTPNNAVLAQSTTTRGSDEGIAANTATSWLVKGVTMPSTGCPCRVYASYGLYFSQTNAGADVAWVYDGTNTFDTAQTANTGMTANYGISASAFSPVTYANSASITFTAYFFTNSAGGATAQENSVGTGFGTPQPSWLNLVVMPSN